MDEQLNEMSRRSHERLVYQIEQREKARQALRNIENGCALASDSATLRNFISKAQ